MLRLSLASHYLTFGQMGRIRIGWQVRRNYDRWRLRLHHRMLPDRDVLRQASEAPPSAAATVIRIMQLEDGRLLFTAASVTLYILHLAHIFLHILAS